MKHPDGRHISRTVRANDSYGAWTTPGVTPGVTASALRTPFLSMLYELYLGHALLPRVPHDPLRLCTTTRAFGRCRSAYLPLRIVRH